MKKDLSWVFRITIACVLIYALSAVGCNNSEGTSKAQENNYQDATQQQFDQKVSSPGPAVSKSIMEPSEQTKRIIENPNLDSYIATPPSNWLTPRDTSTWTPAAQEVARKLADNDYEGAIDVLYQDILNTQPNQSDHFVFYANLLTLDTPAVFKDPSVIYRKYRDSDRSGWSEEQKAAADLLVALTYEFGDNSSYFPEDLPETADYYPLIFSLEVKGLARIEYENVIQRYPGSRIAILASILLERWHDIRSVPLPLERVILIRDEIEKSYPDSVYLTWAEFELALRLSDENMREESRAECGRVLALPDAVKGYDTAEDYTIHSSINL